MRLCKAFGLQSILYRGSTAFSQQYFDIADRRYSGKLTIIPTPIGNMNDISVNIYSRLHDMDVIGCQDTRRAGQLFKLFESRRISDRLFECFGYSRNQLVEYDPVKTGYEELEDKEKLFYDYSKMGEKQRRRLLMKMTVQEEKEFKKEFLVFRATKLLDYYEDKPYRLNQKNEDPLYGLQNPELSQIEKYIRDTRKRKGRGVLLPINTYNETELFDTVLKLLRDYNVGLVSDAGTPCISDPGFRLVRHIRENAPSLPIDVVNGCSSVSVMLVAAYTTNRTKEWKILSGYFEGFSRLLMQHNPNIDYQSFGIFFENAKRLPKVLAHIEELYGAQQDMYVAGEISKKYERRYRGKVFEIRNYLLRAQKKEDKAVGQISYILFPKQLPKKLASNNHVVNPTAVAAILNEEIDATSKELTTIMSRLLVIGRSQATKYIYQVRHKTK